jgi:class 3 adenylate cyclase/predicted ATPase
MDLALRCATCGAIATLPGQRFCGACGAPLATPHSTGRERRLLSVLFCDLVGFTSFSEGRDHEDVRDVLEPYFAAARRTIETYGGTLEKFIGDAVMAVWGAPVAHEDDAERAVRAGIDLVAGVRAVAERLSIPELRVRVGILTGEASVDSGREHEGMVVGDTVNTASRIQSLADANTVLVDDITRLACERAIEFEPGGEHPVKGKSEPVRVWQAVRVLSRVGGHGRPMAVEPPLVGRLAELDSIKRILDEVVGLESGARLLTVVGEAGIGKTRLAWELEKHVDGISLEVFWHLGHAVSYGAGAGMSALAEMLRERAGIALEDPVDVRRERLDVLLSGLFADDHDERSRVRRSIDRLLELDDGRETIARGALFSAWRTFFERLADRGPVVLAFEEMQHAGQALLDFISELLEWAGKSPILIAVFSRPDDRIAELAAHGEAIQLSPLSATEMDELIAGTVREAPEALLATVRTEGGGIPLYAVETLRSLADRGLLEVEDGHYVVLRELGELTVPPTIRALVASRLDGLGELERRVLAAGAVLGERFAGTAASTLVSIDDLDTRSLLGGLVTKALLGVEPDQTGAARGQYFFLQGVLRRVMLDMLSRRDRKRLHLEAATYMSDAELEPERLAALAGHLLAAEEAEPAAADAASIRARALTTMQQAAERAAAVGAIEEALSLFDRAAELVGDEAERAAILERAAVLAQRSALSAEAASRFGAAALLHEVSGHDRARVRARAGELQSLAYERAPSELLPQLRELREAVGDVRDATAALVDGILAFVLYQLGDHAESLEVATRAIKIAEECDAHGEMLLAIGSQAVALQELDRQVEAVSMYERGLPLAQRYEPRRESSFRANLAISLGGVGRYRDAAEQAEAAFEAAHRTSERFFVRHAQVTLGRVLCSLGEWDRAVEELEAGKPHVPTFMVGMAVAPLVVIALARGASDRVLELVAEHDERERDAGTTAFGPDFRALREAVLAGGSDRRAALAGIIPAAEVADYSEWTGWIGAVIDGLVAAGGSVDDLAAALSALNGPEAIKQILPVRAQALRLEGHLAVLDGNPVRAGERFAAAIEAAGACSLAFDVAALVVERAELQAGGDGSELGDALATFERLAATPWVARARSV